MCFNSSQVYIKNQKIGQVVPEEFCYKNQDKRCLYIRYDLILPYSLNVNSLIIEK